MNISAQTKISTIIKANEKAIDVIASINKHFLKLKNPILREVLAPRVTVEQAAKIGKVTPEIILNKLKEIGFDVTISEKNAESEPAAFSENYIPIKENILTLDVRENIHRGKDPLPEIMKALKTAGNSTILIINSFEPIPLIELLKRKGYESRIEKKADNLILTYFTKKESAAKRTEKNNSAVVPSISWEDTLLRFGKREIDLDVRSLEMPWPMIEILNRLSQIEPDTALLVLHRKIPHILLPQLKDRGYACLINETEEGIYLLIFKEERK